MTASDAKACYPTRQKPYYLREQLCASASARVFSMGGPWRGSREARRFVSVLVCQPRYMPAHPCSRVSGDFEYQPGNRAMNKPIISPVHPQVMRIGRAAAEVSKRCADQFADLRALAKLLTKAVEMDPAGSDDHRKVAAVMVRLSGEYAGYARGDANMFAAALCCAPVDEAAGKPAKRARSATPRRTASAKPVSASSS
jgi:hypothetical protein